MRLLGMQIGDASDGHTIPYAQSARRAAALYGPTTVGTFPHHTAGASLFSGLGAIMSLLGLVIAIGWPIYLLTTAQSPTKQGLHDMFAHTMVVKAARAVG